MNDKNLTIIEHIDEIRKRLMVIVVFFVVAVVGSFFRSKTTYSVSTSMMGKQKILRLNAFNVLDPIMIYLKVIIFIAVIVISPILMYQLWSFISPGLHETERRATLNYIPFTFLLFDWWYCVFLFRPASLCDEIHDEFIRRISILPKQLVLMSISRFLFQLMIPFGIVFQLPVVLLFLTRLGILNPTTLVKIRKYAYFGLFVIAAFITPPDLVFSFVCYGSIVCTL